MRQVFSMFFFVCCLLANAQEFKEGLIYDVKGPVKKVTRHGNKLYFHPLDLASFTIDGKLKDTITKFDDAGYPLGWSIDSDSLNRVASAENQIAADIHVSYKVDYDDAKRIVATLKESHINGMEQEWANGTKIENRFYQYRTNSAGDPEVCAMEMYNKNNISEYTTNAVYTDYVYDDHGNWISRNVVETKVDTNNPKKVDSEEYVETRTITYW